MISCDDEEAEMERDMPKSATFGLGLGLASGLGLGLGPCRNQLPLLSLSYCHRVHFEI